ncbi:MAG: S9 family peptidase [Bacteroidota bacterium]
MKTLRYFSIILLLFAVNLHGQEKLLTVEDVILNSFLYSPANLRQLSWVPDTDNYAYTEGNGDQSVLLMGSAKTSKTDTVLTIKELNTKLETAAQKKLNNLPAIKWLNPSTILFWNAGSLFSYDIKFKKINKINSLPEAAENQSLAPNNKYLAYTIANNLFVNLNESNKIQITNDADSNIVNGQAVHRNEFGINEGIFWSPNSNYIAYYRMDQTMVTDYPLVEIDKTPAQLKNIKYPMAGQISHHVTVSLYNILTRKTILLKTGEPLDQYLTNLAWSPDEKYFFIAHLNRDQNHMQFIKYDVASGEQVKILFEEKDNEFVEPLNPMIFLPNSNNRFLWLSERDGYNHFYLYDTEGKLIKQVTQGKWVITSFNGFDKTGKFIYITSTKDSPIERHFYKVNIESGKLEKITKEPGMHNVQKSSNDEYFIDSFNSLKIPRVINLLNKKYEVVKNLLTADNPQKEIKTGETKIFTIKNEEGIELYCRIIYPPDFDPSKKYPVIFYVYGGPHSQGVLNTFGFGSYQLWFKMMAQKGYIIFELDNRGTSNRGSDFAQSTFRKLGTIELKDQMAGVNYLKSLPYFDENRFGVFGWSYGGFMTTSMMLRTNNTFKVGACGGAVIDWKFYEVMYTERYMDTPQSNPDGYKEASLLNYVQNMFGKLLLVHGTSDPTVVWQNTLSFAKRAAELNKPLDYFPYIGHGHGVSGREALHLYNKITNYFLDNL